MGEHISALPTPIERFLSSIDDAASVIAVMEASRMGMIQLISTGSLTLANVRNRWGERAIDLIQLMSQLGLVAVDDREQRIAFSPDAGNLLASNPLEFESFLKHRRNVLCSLLQLTEVLGKGQQPTQVSAGPNAEDYVKAMHFLATWRKIDLTKFLTSIRCNQVLDAGCGSGFYAYEALECLPKANATLVDLPNILPITQKYAQAHLTKGISLMPADLRYEALPPSTYDLALLFSVIHQYGVKDNGAVIRNIQQSLAPSGLLLLCDYVALPDERSKRHANFSLMMSTVTDQGHVYTTDELLNLLRRSGFCDIQFSPAGVHELTIVSCKKGPR